MLCIALPFSTIFTTCFKMLPKNACIALEFYSSCLEEDAQTFPCVTYGFAVVNFFDMLSYLNQIPQFHLPLAGGYYSWISSREELYIKLICQQTEGRRKNPRPPLELSQKTHLS